MADISRVELARILLCKKEYKQARENLKTAFLNEKSESYALSELVYLAIREEKYEEAYRIYKMTMQDNEYWTPQRRAQIERFLGYKLDNIRNIRFLSDNYFGSQLMDYSEDRTIEHIKLHLDEDEEKRIHSTFLEDVNIEEIYEDSKTRITSINPSGISVIDKYRLEFDRPIGVVKQEEVDAAMVVTFPNTYDILSIYPVYNPKTRVKKV